MTFIYIGIGYIIGSLVMYFVSEKQLENMPTDDEIIYNALQHLTPVQKIEVMQSIYGKNWMEHVPTED